MEDKFKGSVVLVTGAARGVGRGIALHFARLGADVAIADLNLQGAKDFGETLGAESVEAEITALGRRSIGFEGNLGSSDQAERFIAQTVAAFGRIDVLVNCAGGAVTPHALSKASISPDEEIAKTFAANYLSMVYCCRAAVPHMRAQGGGAIVNIASVAGIMPTLDGSIAHYGASKAALINYTRSLASEVGPDGIRANAVAPGVVLTARIKALASERGSGTSEQAARAPLRRHGESEDIAKVVQFFASDLASFVTGQCLIVSGGLPSVAC
jgi:NAD(P)-dependent dehydrogenase (short-subunit alcohol dehydrogenase family)